MAASATSRGTSKWRHTLSAAQHFRMLHVAKSLHVPGLYRRILRKHSSAPALTRIFFEYRRPVAIRSEHDPVARDGQGKSLGQSRSSGPISSSIGSRIVMTPTVEWMIFSSQSSEETDEPPCTRQREPPRVAPRPGERH